MMPNSTSPTPIRKVEEQIQILRQRRSAVDRLIRALEEYQRLGRRGEAKKIA